MITALTSDGMVAPELLDRSEERQQLHGHGAVRQPLDQQHVDGGPQEHSSARHAACRLRPDAGRRAGDPGRSADARGDHAAGYVPLGAVADIQQINTPTEVDHYQIRRVIDIYVATKTEALQSIGAQHRPSARRHQHDRNTVIDVRGAVVSMNQAFHDFGSGSSSPSCWSI